LKGEELLEKGEKKLSRIIARKGEKVFFSEGNGVLYSWKGR